MHSVLGYFNGLLVLFSVQCCVCSKRLSSPSCRSELIESAWVVIVPGQKCIQKLTHITKLFIMRSYNESNLTFINHMHVLSEIRTNSVSLNTSYLSRRYFVATCWEIRANFEVHCYELDSLSR